ncbi:uncharacterized protein LOC106873372 [Octopus bimaculoides]|uniref:uncharacterized protein LOC106873372 n=1 Tax=Octopus bimaculoides TaxID=37653 RepID=UPI00071CDE99|nr:uncharacterized protein LOC106873372 [Octopus bimaculoides]|eukprot:XP_014776189.1 PREDICTED: uncharacterized protein LOC106873372 [Octopus bimaculoides]
MQDILLKVEFAEEMIFCKSIESTTTVTDIYDKLKNFLHVNNIPIKNITFGAAGGAPVMIDKKKSCLKLMKNENPEMLLVHCVVHRENLASKNMSPVLNEVLKSVIKCINAIKANAKCERLFKQFCENADYVRLLFQTEVRRLSKRNYLTRFMELFDVLSDFLSDKPEMKRTF